MIKQEGKKLKRGSIELLQYIRLYQILLSSHTIKE